MSWKRITHLVLFVALLFSTACGGFPLPFTERRAFNLPIESSRSATNSDCTTLEHLNAVASAWEQQHLKFIRSRDRNEAIPVESLIKSLGEGCQERWENLGIPRIKNELFGDLQTVNDSAKLRELGGVLFRFGDVSTMSGIEYSLHLRTHKSGPDRLVVAIFSLEDNRVIHYNYSGTNNVNGKSRRWPIDEFLGTVFGIGTRLIPID